MQKRPWLCALAMLATSAGAFGQSSRDYISIVGSSTVYPFATVVAERFGKSSGFKTPKIESTGSGGGLKLFCAGIGVEYPDITNASRRIQKSELDACAKNGVNDVVEVKIGYDGIVFGTSKKNPQIDLSLQDIFIALAKTVPNPDGSPSLVANPYSIWQQVSNRLPNRAIKVLGPPPTSGTRDAFIELVMEAGCSKFDFIKKLAKSDKDQFKTICHSMREDGKFVEAGENDNLIVQKLDADPDTFGIFGFSFLDQNTDTIQGTKIAGVEPSFENIAEGSYPVARPLFFYVKKAHVGNIPGIKEFVAEFTSERAWGEDGYLADKGMIPMPDAERERFAADASALKAMRM